MAIAKVGDYVRITKIPQIKGYSEILKVGDVGRVTYLANTTMKYSVHIDGKKNPADIEHPKSRAYGEKYDFWIPPYCCEIVKTELYVGHEEDLMRQCLFENADALDKWQATWDDVPDDIKELVEMGLYTKEEALAKCSNNTYQEREEIKMKEIRNQKVVDLYYDRKEKELKDAMIADIEAARNNDLHQKFVADLKKSFDKYVKDHSLELKSEVNFDVSLPYTDERIETVEKIREQGLDSIAKIYSEKKEVLAMLSGCETYEQEMAILRSYGIVGKDNKLVGQTN